MGWAFFYPAPVMALPGYVGDAKPGGALARYIARLLTCCSSREAPFCLGSPESSAEWEDKRICRILHACEASTVIIDQCALGQPWRKRTRFAFCHVPDPVLVPLFRGKLVRCHGHHGYCSFFPGRKHLVLGGSMLRSRSNRYPTDLSRLLIGALCCHSVSKSCNFSPSLPTQ